MHVTPVFTLLLPTSPAAIVGAIAFVIVYAIKRHTGGAIPHVGKKVIKIVPSFANGNSPAAIVGVIFHGWVEASVSHSSPRIVSPRTLCSMSKSSLSKGILRSQAPARGCFPSRKGTIYNDFCPPAFASTEPRSVLADPVGRTNYGKMSVYLSWLDFRWLAHWQDYIANRAGSQWSYAK